MTLDHSDKAPPDERRARSQLLWILVDFAKILPRPE
jgi:hypothetical protein